MAYTEVTGMHRLVEAVERIAISVERIEQRLADHPALQLTERVVLPVEYKLTTIRTKVDKDNDRWFELTPGLWTWGRSDNSLRAAHRVSKNCCPGDSDLINVPEAELMYSAHAPFTESDPVPMDEW